MREQLQQLIAEGRTEEALALLVQHNSDAVLLQARYNQAKKQQNMGLIDFGEWSRVQAQVNYAALEMAGQVKVGGSSGAAVSTPSPAPAAQPARPGVFISYNHNDSFPMRAVKAHLEDHDIKVFVDIQDMGVGDNISAFIDKAFKENQFILSIISQNSLKSGWVNKELGATFLLNRFGSKWLPVLLDNSCFDNKFYNETMDIFDAKMKDIDAEIQTALSKGRGLQAFTDERARLKDLQNDFDSTIQNLKGHLAVDITGNSFDSGMAKVVRAIKGA